MRPWTLDPARAPAETATGLAATSNSFPDHDAAAIEKILATLGIDHPAVTELLETREGSIKRIIRLTGQPADRLLTAIELTGPFTVETWIKLEPGIDNSDGILGRKGSLDINFAVARLRVYGGPDAGDHIIANRCVEPGIWIHCAVVRDADGRFTLYFDGEADSDTATITASTGFPELQTPEQQRAAQARFDRFRALATQPGDIARGKQLAQASCLICHQVQDEGIAIGPDLSGAGVMGIDSLLRNILTPNEALESGYYRHDIRLTDGTFTSGFLAAESPETLTLRRIGADDLVIPSNQIASHNIAKRSLMPEGLIDGYSEMWMPYCFDRERIDRELALAADIGFNCLRVVLPFVVWEHDPAAFRKRFDTFLEICAKHGLRVMPCLFDDCAFGSDEKLKNPWYGRQPEVIEGWYASGWTPSPGHDMVRDPQTWPQLENYVTDIMTSFKGDPRVWVWDLYNEPTHSGTGDVSITLAERVFRWARAVNPSQPLTLAEWNDNKKLNAIIHRNSDVVSFHSYHNAEKLAEQIRLLKEHGRPVINTEWLNRPRGSTVADCLPLFATENVGCMHWGLANGKTQTDLGWGSRPGGPRPEVWQHDLFRGDHTPYDRKELDLFRRTIGKSRSVTPGQTR